MAKGIFEKRFGMFVHWGVYALEGFHEQEIFKRQMTRAEYSRKLQNFDPVKFDPDAWLDLCRDAGMEYIVFTAKHIDGFCMWDTKCTRFNIMNSPYGRDTLAMLADCCRRRNFPLGIYYSIADCTHPNYPSARRSYERWEAEPGDEPDLEKYLAYVREQVRELCTGYGKISAFFWDANMLGVKDRSFNEMIRSLQPDCAINDRGFDEGDYGTPERDYDSRKAAGPDSFPAPTEACQAIGMQSWGWKSDEDYYTSKYLIKSMDKYFVKGANYLLNVGPCADGTIAPEYARVLRKIGSWRKSVSEAFDGAANASDEISAPGMLATRRGGTLYVHLNTDPQGSAVIISPLTEVPRKVTLLNDGRPLEARHDMGVKDWYDKPDHLRVRNIPAEDFADSIMILKLEY